MVKRYTIQGRLPPRNNVQGNFLLFNVHSFCVLVSFITLFYFLLSFIYDLVRVRTFIVRLIIIHLYIFVLSRRSIRTGDRADIHITIVYTKASCVDSGTRASRVLQCTLDTHHGATSAVPCMHLIPPQWDVSGMPSGHPS